MLVCFVNFKIIFELSFKMFAKVYIFTKLNICKLYGK